MYKEYSKIPLFGNNITKCHCFLKSDLNKIDLQVKLDILEIEFYVYF